ncbi:MAG: PD-(D/E)XK nuclease family protein, partial [Bacteroidota bacterium]
YLHQHHPDDLQSHVVVVPNIRAGLYLRKYLSEQIQQSAWGPAIISIQEFFHRQSKLNPEEPLPLVFELYKCIKQVKPGLFESFDAFYPWGEIILSDFNDIDKNLVNPVQLFANIKDLKEIDVLYADINEELINHLRQFWAQFDIDANHYSKKRFLEVWKHMAEVYEKFTEHLKDNNLGYEGLITRSVAENLDNELFPDDKPGHYFVGFNVLSKAEEHVFRYYKNHHDAVFFWQYDESLLQDSFHEAFRFVRELLYKFPMPADFTYQPEIRQKKVMHVYSVPSNTAQVKLASRLLKEHIKPEDPDFENTGLVLPDESLLHPVLYSMPDCIDHLNVTMGYPISYAPQTSIISLLARLQKNYASGKYYHQDVLKVLNHPLVQLVAQEYCKNIKKQIVDENMLRVHEDILKPEDSSLLRDIFTHTDDVMEMGPYFSRILKQIYESMRMLENVEFDKEVVYQMYRHINRFNEYLVRDRIHFESVKTYLWLVTSMLNNLSVSFSGEPMKGLQVMGMLETRLIDFDKLIILSMNEGHFPGQSFKKSFIPFGLRKAFQLPTIELQDAIHAYYFYRMIMHPDEVYLLYNTVTEGFNKGEKSRYIQQMAYELDLPLKEIPVLNQTISNKKEDREVAKDAYAMNIIQQYEGPNAVSKFSPSQLNTYLKCSMAFYYKYILNIKEPDEMVEQIGQLELGNVLHEAMSKLYAPYLNNEIRADIIDAMLKDEQKLNKVVLDAFEKHMKTSADPMTGINAMGMEAVKIYVRGILQGDKKRLPFVYKGGEAYKEAVLLQKNDKQTKAWHFHGTIDRLEMSDNVLRVIDYKTGKANKTEAKNLDDIFEQDRKKDYDHLLQILFYAWLVYSQDDTMDKQNAIQLYPLLVYARGGDAFQGVKSEGKQITDFRDLAAEFEQQLSQLIDNISNPDNPFRMTADNKSCENCPYRTICGR